MIVFTIWSNNPIPDNYQKCLDSMRKAYPELQVINVGDIDLTRHAGWVTDRARIAILAEQFIGENVLYLDMDCMINRRIDPPTKPAFYNLIGGVLDYCCIYKPAGCEQFFQKMLADGVWTEWAWIQRAINSVYRSQVGILYGYPIFDVKHLYLSKEVRRGSAV